MLAHYENVAREAVLRWHQAPLWDPYYCGGMYLLGTPQARFVSPTFVLTLLFGEARGEALAVFVMLIVGLEGTMPVHPRPWRDPLRRARSRRPCSRSAGIFAISPSLGWMNFFGFELLPWMALGVRRALAARERASSCPP